MRYQITISKAGTVIDTVVVEAPNALAGINRLEAAYEKHAVQLSVHPGEVVIVLWCGYEFEARSLDDRDKRPGFTQS